MLEPVQAQTLVRMLPDYLERCALVSDVRFIPKRMGFEYIQGKNEFKMKDISRITLVYKVGLFIFSVLICFPDHLVLHLTCQSLIRFVLFTL